MCRTVPHPEPDERGGSNTLSYYTQMIVMVGGSRPLSFKLYASFIPRIRIVLAAVRVLQSKHTLLQTAT